MRPRQERRIPGYTKIHREGAVVHRFEALDEDDDKDDGGIDFDALFTERQELEGQLKTEETKNRLGRLIGKYHREEYRRQATGKKQVDWRITDAATSERLRPIIHDIVAVIKKEGLLDEEIEDVLDINYLPDIQQAMNKEQMSASELLSLQGGGGITNTKGHITIDAQTLRRETSDSILFALATTGGSENFSLLFHEKIHSVQMPHVAWEERMAKQNQAIAQETKAASELQRILGITSLLMMANTESLARTAVITIPVVLLAGMPALCTKIRSFIDFQKKSLDTGALMEVHAYKAEMQLHSANTTTGVMLKRLTRLPYLYGLSSRYKDRIIMGCQEIERLRALGAKHEMIAALVGRAKWDDERIGYDTLEHEIERRAEERGLDPIQVDTLVDARRIQRDIRLLKIRKIVQDRILEVCDREGIQNEA